MEIINYVERAIEADSGPLTIVEFIRTTDYPIDQLYVDAFWTSIRDDVWMYLSNDLINYLGYKSKEAFKRKEKCLKLLQTNFEIDVHYKVLNNEQYFISLTGDMKFKGPVLDTSHGKNNTKHILVTPSTFREMTVCVNTPKSKQIRKYYLAVERLLKDYTKYQNQYQIAIRDKETALQLADMESKIQEMTITAKKYKCLDDYNETINKNLRLENKNDSVYIITSKNYAQERLFKIGRASTISKRISSLNTGRINEDVVYLAHSAKCHDAKEVEHRMHKILYKLKHDKEWYRFSYNGLCNLLDDVCENFEKDIESYHKIIDTYLHDEIVIPEPIFIAKTTLAIENVEYIDTLNKEQIEELIVAALNKYLGYDCTDPRESKVKVVWKDVQRYLKEVSPQKINRISKWRDAFKTFLTADIYDCTWRKSESNIHA